MHASKTLTQCLAFAILLFGAIVSQVAVAQSSQGTLSPAQRLFGSPGLGDEDEDERQARGASRLGDRDLNFKRSMDGSRWNWDDSAEQRPHDLADETEQFEDDAPLYEDFSRYIRDTTGKYVSDALPLARSKARSPKLPETYLIGPGDEIEIQVWGSLSARYKLRVDEAGRVFVPEVGSVQLEGVRASDLSNVMSGQFRRLFKGFELRAFIVSSRGVMILVTGHASSVGLKSISATHSLLSATLSQARPSPGGSRRFVEFRREGSPAKLIDLYCFFRTECEAMPATLKDNDVIRVPPRGKLVAVSGGVSRPGIYELKDSEGVSDLLRYAGGLSVVADAGRVNLYSFAEPTSGDRVLKTTALSGLCTGAGGAATASCTALRDGDYLDIQLHLPLVRGAITIVAPGVDPIKLEHRPGMKLLDVLSPPFDRLIPRKTLGTMNAGAFATLQDLDDRLRRLDLEALTLYRRDADKREYAPIAVNYRAAATQGLAGASNIELQDGDVLVIEDQSEWKARRSELPMSVRVLGEVGKPGRYRFVGLKTLDEVLNMAGGLTPDAAVWNAVILRLSDGRTSVGREVLDQALKTITAHQLRQEAMNSDKAAAVGATTIVKDDRKSGTVQTLGNRAKAEVLELMKDRELIYLSSRGDPISRDIRLSPNDIVLIPPVQDTYSCQGAFFKPGEFMIGKGAVSVKDAAKRCGLIDEMSPNVYHFVSRQNRICRLGWFSSCPDVESGDVVVAVPEVVTKRGAAAFLEWMDIVIKPLTALATLKVLTD
jgi:protein involved in polysaccharide export with SLBB domain